MQENETPTGVDLVRCIATARVVMPRTVVRLSAGRLNLSVAEQVCIRRGVYGTEPTVG